MIIIPTITDVFEDINGDLIVEHISKSSKNMSVLSENLGPAPIIKQIYKEFETKSFVFKVVQNYLGEEIKILIPRDAAMKKYELLKYSTHGLNVDDSNAHHVIKWFRKQDTGAPPVLIHTGIGFDLMETEDGDFIPVFKGYRGLGGLDSKYHGKLKIKPQGTMKDYRAFCRKHINGAPLALALALGLSSALVGFLGDKLQADCLVAHFSGDSSSGKTTAAKLAVGTGSFPSFHAESSLLNNYDGTENSLLTSVLGNMGFCCCFDEANMQEKQDFSSFIYRLASGRGKQRLTREGKLKGIETYRTTIISTAEKNLTKNSNQNTGKEIRVLTFNSVAWTTDAKHAEMVNAFVEENYGWPLIYMSDHLLTLGIDEVMKRYEANRKLFLDASLVKDTFTSRLSAKYSFILTTVELANERMKLQLPFDYVLDMLLKHEAETMASRDIALKAYEYLLEQANVNHDKFYPDWTKLALEDFKSLPVLREVWGKKVSQEDKPLVILGERKCTMIIYFAKKKFEELLRKGNFEEPAVVIKKLKEKQLLVHEKDRGSWRCKIVPRGQSVSVYALRVLEDPDCEDVKKEHEQELERAAKAQAKTRIVNKKNPTSKKASGKQETKKDTHKYYIVNYNGNWYSVLGEYMRLNMTIVPLGNQLAVCHDGEPVALLSNSNVSKLLKAKKNIDNNCFINYNNWWYPVPHEYAGLDLIIKPNGNSLVLYHNSNPVEVHQAESSEKQALKKEADLLEILNDETDPD